MSHQTLPAASTRIDSADGSPVLETGDHLDQPTFHRLYAQLPENIKAELIGGIVFRPSPLKRPHGKMHVLVIRWLSQYEEETPGTELFDNTTVIMGPESEPQPDVHLVISSDNKGQTREEEEYTVGAPELITEVASTAHSIDLHRKKEDYRIAGVKEYIVIVLKPARVIWMVLREGNYEELAPGADGTLRSEVFPGLWLDPAALLALDRRRVLEVLRQGLASPEHAVFVTSLGQNSSTGGV
jgi:Uma2 family endonuclease